MGFVARGCLSAIVINRLTGCSLRLPDLERGQHFGESMITGDEENCSVEAIAYSELLELTKKDFVDVSEHNPEMRVALLRIARARKVVISLGHKLCLPACKKKTAHSDTHDCCAGDCFTSSLSQVPLL